jgi:hypothetical protein
MGRIFAVAVLVLGISAPAFAQNPWDPAPGFTRMLIPVYTQEAPGAFGSLWSTDLRVFNAGAAVAQIAPRCTILCISVSIPPGSEVDPIRVLGFPGGSMRQPFFFSVSREVLSQLTWQLRVYDESRADLNWGTTIPVVDYETEKANDFWFLEVPAASPFRHTVRIYTRSIGAGVLGRYYDTETDALVIERTYPLDDFYLQLDSLGFPELAGLAAVRIQTEAVGGPIWSMVSVTNNDTQVITILPGKTYPAGE